MRLSRTRVHWRNDVGIISRDHPASAAVNDVAGNHDNVTFNASLDLEDVGKMKGAYPDISHWNRARRHSMRHESV